MCPAGVVPLVPWDLGHGTLEMVLDHIQPNMGRDPPFFPAYSSQYRNLTESHFGCKLSDQSFLPL